MQNLTAAPRQEFAAETVRELLTADGVVRGFGCDVWEDGRWVDISRYVHKPWKVRHKNGAEVHGSLNIELTRSWPWGRTWFRPWMTLAPQGAVQVPVRVIDAAAVNREAATVSQTWDTNADWHTGTVSGNMTISNGALSGTGEWISAPIPLTGLTHVERGSWRWVGGGGPYQRVSMDISLDGGATWQPNWAGTLLGGIAEGEDLSDKFLLVKLRLSGITVSPPTVTSLSVSLSQYEKHTEEQAHIEYRTEPYAARFNAGVYLLTTPTRTHGRDPVVYRCSGKDLLTLATRRVGDTYVVEKGTTYLDALRAIFRDQLGMRAPLLDGSAQDTVLPEDRVWCLTANPRWLDIANGLMEEIAYTDVFLSPDGVPRAVPTEAEADRAAEWTFDTGVPLEDLIAADYTEKLDLWAAPNQWRFVRRGLDYRPAEGDGIYEFTNTEDGPASVESVGLNPAPTQWLDAADQAALVAEGKRAIAADRRAEAAYEISVDPLPIAWHRDVVRLVGDGRSVKIQVTDWSLTPLGKSSWTLGGGGGGAAAEPVNVSTTGTVTQASPLRVVVDGADTDSMALALADDSGAVPSYSVGTRVQVTVRNPLPPLVAGSETSLEA